MRNVVDLTSGILRASLKSEVASGAGLGRHQCRRFTLRATFSPHSPPALSPARRPASLSPSCRPVLSWKSSTRRTFAVSANLGRDKKSSTKSIDQKVATKTASPDDTSSATEPQSPTSEPELSWRSYDPAGGLPLPSGDLPPATLDTIFPEPLDPEVANWIIRLMNYRRHSGSLIDQGITFPASQGITPDAAFAALTYLRRIEPDLDESAAGIAWAESEIAALSEPYIQRAEKLGLYRRIDDDDASPPPEEQAADPDERTSTSQLLAMKRANVAAAQEAARREQEERNAAAAAQEQATAASDPAGLPSTATATGRAALARQERAAWVAHYAQRAQLSSATVAPSMSVARRLGPALGVTAGVLGLCLVLHAGYVAPPDAARMWPDVPASAATLAALVGVQLLVAVGYRWPPLWRLYNKYFVMVAAQPRAVSVVLASVTHQQFSHWFWNAVLLVAFGRYLHDDTDRGTLLAVFFATGTASNFVSLASHVLRKNWAVYTYGSSSAVYGVLTATCLLRADHDVSLFGYQLPMTGLLFLGLFALLDGMAFLRGGAVAQSINFAGHFAGFVTGGLCALGLRWEKSKRKEAEEGGAVDSENETMRWTGAASRQKETRENV